MIHSLQMFVRVKKSLNYRQFLYLLKSSFYLNDSYLVYRAEAGAADVGEGEGEELPGLVIRKGSFEELDVALHSSSNLPYQFRRHLFDYFRDFYVAEESGVIKHISWIYTHEDHNRLLALDREAIEIKYCYTSPECRGRGVYPKVLRTIVRHAIDMGNRHVFMSVLADNQPSIRGIEKAGFALVGSVRFMKFCGIPIMRRLDTSVFLSGATT